MTVNRCGLTLHGDFPYLGASADGIINDSTVLEIKCPYSGRDKSISELIDNGYKHIYYDEENNLALKQDSKYYCQVQGEMAIKRVQLCHFVVWTPIEMAVISVNFDSSYWHNILLPVLNQFYANHILPALL